MKKISLLVIASAVTIFFGGNSFAANTYSGQAVEDASKASTHASGSAANAIVGSGQVTSAVSAVPLGASGASGEAGACCNLTVGT